MDNHDVVIVGGRAAGAATAMLLARAGHRVLVLERDRRGTDTLSTHALLRSGVLQLERWGLLDRIIDAGTPPQHRVVFHYGDDRVPVAVSRALYAPRRTVLDPTLVAAAEAAGAEFRFGVDVRGIARHRGRVVGVVTRSGEPIAARFTVGADGRRSLVAREVGAAVLHQGCHAAAALYGYWDGVDAQGYEWAYRPGVAAGLIPTNDGLTCVYAGLPPDRFLSESRTDLGAALGRILPKASPDLADRVAAGRRVGPVRGHAGLVGWLRQPRGPGWALVGDAGYFKDPITAHGLSDALRDAELLARELHAELSGRPGPPGPSFRALRDDLSTDFFAVTDRIASFAWDLAELQQLHLAMSDAMRAEYDHLAGLDPMPALTGPRV